MTELLTTDTAVHIGGVDHFSYTVDANKKGNQGIFLYDAIADGHLKCGPERNIKNGGGRGVWSRWLVAPEESNMVSLQNVGHKDNGDSVYLGVSNGVFVPVENPQPLSIEPVLMECEDEVIEEKAIPKFTLSDDDRKTFVDTGVLHLPGLVQDHLVNSALASINQALGVAWNGADENAHDPETGLIATSRKSPEVLNLLYKSPIIGVTKQLLGNKPKLCSCCQVALRFPHNRNPDDKAWHIDGTDTIHMTPFQILVGVALSSQPTEDCGNLVVFPGHHRELHDAVRRAREARQEALKDKEEDDIGPSWMKCRPVLEGKDSKQVLLEPGDVILAHQKIPHRVAHNASPHIRYMVYFRISHKRHRPHGPLGGLWEYFEGVQDLLEDDEKTCLA